MNTPSHPEGAQTGPPVLPPAAAPAPACIGCGYTFAGLDTAVCPECGITQTPEDLRAAERRRIYLELSWPSTFARLALVVLFALAMSPLLAWWWAMLGGISTAWCVGVGLLGFAAEPRLHARLARRLWFRAVPWLQLFWMLPMAAMAVSEWGPWSYSISMQLDWVLPSLHWLSAAGVLVGVSGALWSLKRHARLASLPLRLRAFPIWRQHLLVAIGVPAGGILAISGVSLAVVILDFLVPHWDVG